MRVTVSDLAKEFHTLRRHVTALGGVSLTIEDGEFFVLLGPSGCGKSTLLNLIAGLEKPSSGCIRFGENPVAEPSKRIFLEPKERNVAFVFQNYALYPHMTVYENIAFPLKIAGQNKASIASAVEQAAATLGIWELLQAKPAHLSGGQRQRVAIARAIVRKPNVFLLDEPLSNLDAQLRVSMRTELRDLQRRLGITTVYVTHDQVEAMSLGHRVAVLNKGSIEQVGTPQELYDSPATPFVARFIGSPPMNLIPAALSADSSKLVIASQSITIPEGCQSMFRNAPAGGFLLGIRPEHISIAASEKPGNLKSQVKAVESLGRETLVHVNVGDTMVTLLAAQTSLSPDENICLALNLSKACVFPHKV
jgi:multiple sugar transport system ATP-binding protein